MPIAVDEAAEVPLDEPVFPGATTVPLAVVEGLMMLVSVSVLVIPLDEAVEVKTLVLGAVGLLELLPPLLDNVEVEVDPPWGTGVMRCVLLLLLGVRLVLMMVVSTGPGRLTDLVGGKD